MESELIKRWENLILYIYPHLEKFPKTQRHRLVAKIEREHYCIYDLLVTANTRWQKNNRTEILKEVDTKLKIYTFSLRIAHEMQFLKTKQWEVSSKMLSEIGRMLGAQINKR